jgi:O-antigen/teichoic acid export membrane protein
VTGDDELDPTHGGAVHGVLSVASGAVVKLFAEALALVASFITGVVTARNLGPSGKGTLASLGFLAVLLGATASLGLGEAGATAMARGRSIRSITGPTFVTLALSSAAGLAVFLAVSRLQWSDRWEDVALPVALIALSLPCTAVTVVLSTLLDASGGFVLTSATRVLITVATAVLTAVFVLGMHHGLAGAALAGSLGWLVGPTVLLVALVRDGGVSRPRWDAEYLRPALRHGVPVQISQLLMMATTRVDLLLVGAIVGASPAGLYSVALTLGALNTFPALSLAGAGYPRVAGLPDHEVGPYVARLVVTSILAAVMLGLAVACLLPLTPLAFGDGFRGTVAPAAVLLLAGVLWSPQWVFCRAAAARGQGAALIKSFGTSLAVMLAADGILVPTNGIMGAAIGAVLASAAGLGVVFVHAHRVWGVTAIDIVPTPSHAADAAGVLLSLVRGAENAGRQVDGADDEPTLPAEVEGRGPGGGRG